MICGRASSALSRVLRDLIIIPHSQPFVKRFLKSFFQVFSKSFHSLLASGEEVPEYYITSLFVCQEVFQKFFQLFFVISFPRLPSRLPARGQLAYYSTFGFICQQVFAKFFEFVDSVCFVQNKGIAFVHNAHKMSVLVPDWGMRGVGDTHFPRFEPLQAHVGVLGDHADPSRGRAVNHERLDELIVNI